MVRGSGARPTRSFVCIRSWAAACQVIPESNLRTKQQGEPVDLAEQECWQAYAWEFFSRNPSESKDARRRRLSSKRSVPDRIPSLTLMRALEHALHSGLGLSLSWFDNNDALEAWEGKYLEDADLFQAEEAPPAPTSLCVTGDECSSQ